MEDTQHSVKLSPAIDSPSTRYLICVYPCSSVVYFLYFGWSAAADLLALYAAKLPLCESRDRQLNSRHGRSIAIRGLCALHEGTERARSVEDYPVLAGRAEECQRNRAGTGPRAGERLAPSRRAAQRGPGSG